MVDLEKCTQSVCEIARRAGAYIKGERQKFSLERVERKHAHDYVSYVDKGSERLIVAALKELLPEAGFITEEGTAEGDSPPVLGGRSARWHDELHPSVCSLCREHRIAAREGYPHRRDL